MLAGLVLTALSLLFLYFIIRKAVHHGILDAEETKRERAAEASLRGALSKSREPGDRPADGP